MSNEKHETIADIVAEMRSDEFDDPMFDRYGLMAARAFAKDWADRIEAAAERERRRAMTTPRTWEECAENARKYREGWDDVY